jgi:hypothetical protein
MSAMVQRAKTFGTKASAATDMNSNHLEKEDGSGVRGRLLIKKKISPDNTIRVRDPAKEIFGTVRNHGYDGPHHHRPHVYGTIRTHSPLHHSHPKSYLDILQQKLWGKDRDIPDSRDVVYGKERHYHVETSPSWFKTVQGMVHNQNKNTHPGLGMFDIVREKLLSIRHRNTNLSSYDPSRLNM